MTVKSEGPIIEVTSDKHKPFSKENLDKALEKTTQFAKELRRDWDDNNWFPCGFVSLKAESKGDLMNFIKKNGETDGLYYYYGILTAWKRCATGYNINIAYRKIDLHDAIVQQCMAYKQRVAEFLQKELALMHQKISVNTMID